MTKTTSDNILTSFLLTLLGGTLIRVLFFYVNQLTLEINIYKTFLIGFMIDSLVLSILFLPALLFLILRIHFPKYLISILIFQRSYLFTIISLFLLTSFVDIFIFQIYHHRLDLFLIQQALNTPFPMLLNMLSSNFKYEILLIPILFIIAYGCICWNIPIEKIHHLFLKKIFNKDQAYKKIVLEKQIQTLLVSYLLIFIFTSFIYMPFYSSKSFNQIINSQRLCCINMCRRIMAGFWNRRKASALGNKVCIKYFIL